MRWNELVFKGSWSVVCNAQEEGLFGLRKPGDWNTAF